MWSKLERIAGILGTIIFVAIYIHTPSFPTPDKLLVFLILLSMIFGQARELLKRFVPFAVLLLIYDSFRSIANQLNTHVNYLFMPAADKFLFFGHLPTKALQNWLWHGHVQWYDFVFYGAYTLHFVMPFALAVLIWKTRDKEYWRFVTTYVTLSFAGFLTYVAFPASPPWLASDKGLIQPVAHVATSVWYAFGIHDFPSVYNKLAPNQVAAMPSLHSAYALLFALFITRLYKTKWRYLAWIFPALIWFGTVYMGEHYVIDAIAGVLYALGAYKVAPYINRWLQANFQKLKKRWT